MKTYQSYRGSGVPWLGEVPQHWGVEKGKWLFRRMERPVRPEDEVVTAFRDGTVTLRKNRRLDGFTNSLLEIGYQGVREGDLVIHAMDAFAGAIGVSDSDGKCTPVYSLCVPKKDEHPTYYCRLLRSMSRSGYIEALARGIRERSSEFRYDQFANLDYTVPPRPEQDAIVAFLEAKERDMSAFMSNKQRMIELLKEQKTALINHAVTRGLNANIPRKPSGISWLGDIPKHWEAKKIKHQATILRGKFTHRPRNDPALYDGAYPFIQTGNVTSTTKYIRGYSQTLNERGLAVSKMFPKGTLVMTIAANIGDMAILDFEACFPDSIVGFSPNPRTDLDYLFYLLCSMKPEFLKIAPVNTQANLNIDRVGAMWTVRPPLDEQKQIVSFIEAKANEVAASIAAAEREIELMEEYRTALIAAVVTGKVKVY
jgi:type I restriction enzyme, S subunit